MTRASRCRGTMNDTRPEGLGETLREPIHAFPNRPSALPQPHPARFDRSVRGLHQVPGHRCASAVEDPRSGCGRRWHAASAHHHVRRQPAARPHLRAGWCRHERAAERRRDTRLRAPTGVGGALRHLRLHGVAGARRSGTAAGQAGDDALDVAADARCLRLRAGGRARGGRRQRDHRRRSHRRYRLRADGGGGVVRGRSRTGSRSATRPERSPCSGTGAAVSWVWRRGRRPGSRS